MIWRPHDLGNLHDLLKETERRNTDAQGHPTLMVIDGIPHRRL
jgi:hypothetical protein